MSAKKKRKKKKKKKKPIESGKSQFHDEKKKPNNMESEQISSVLPHSLRNFAVNISRVLK